MTIDEFDAGLMNPADKGSDQTPSPQPEPIRADVWRAAVEMMTQPEFDESLMNPADKKSDQTPVAWMYVNTDGECEQIEYGPAPDDPCVTPLYAHPPRSYTPMTDGEMLSMRLTSTEWSDRGFALALGRAIERAVLDKLGVEVAK